MSKYSHVFVATIVALLASFWSTQIMAQVRAQQGQVGVAREPAKQMKTMVTERDMADCLILDNLGEMRLSKLGLEHSQNEKVREYAKKMVEDHFAMIQKIKQAGFGRDLPPQAITLLQAIAQQRQGKQGEAHQEKPVEERQQGGGRGEVGLLQLKMEVGDNMFSLVRSELEQKKGNEFDLAFMHCEVGMHQHMLAGLQALKQHASPELLTLINAALPITQAHIQQAKTIVQGLSHPQTAQKPVAGGRR